LDCAAEVQVLHDPILGGGEVRFRERVLEESAERDHGVTDRWIGLAFCRGATTAFGLRHARSVAAEAAVLSQTRATRTRLTDRVGSILAEGCATR
jgi:hypothetical protein